MYDAYISMIIDPNACLYDAPMHDAYIYDPPSLTLMHESMMRYFLVTNERTDKAILGVGCMYSGGMHPGYMYPSCPYP